MSLIQRMMSTFSNNNEKLLIPYRKKLIAINNCASKYNARTDDELKADFTQIRERVSNGEDCKNVLVDTFAIIREASMRTLKMRHFDEQLLGGMALFDGNIAEMKTGEGKTLSATLPICLEAMTGKGVHVVTVNDYLSHRDAGWMGDLYRFLGFSVGVNGSQMKDEVKRFAYNCDITYGTNNEFGFDYLRDNMRYNKIAGVQRPLNFAIVDEVDSILIDEARTPLIISGESSENITIYNAIAKIATHFKQAPTADSKGDFIMDEKSRSINLTESGFEHAEKLLSQAKLIQEGESLYAPNNLPLLHHLDVALRALHLFVKDKDYVVQDDQIIIVDEFTGRLMPGRRWGDNQHQAVEAKEGTTIQKENQTLASISLQNYFRLYGRVAGMTGTAKTEAEEFNFIYGLNVLEIPTHQKMVRNDELDKVYQNKEAKTRAILNDIIDSNKRGQPVLVGTTSIEESERLSQELTQNNLEHNVLNAKKHDSEARIISQAGTSQAITISTNMAGRGTDIVLGGNISDNIKSINDDESQSEEQRAQQIKSLNDEWINKHQTVLDAGGLRVIGTERHESRRIDNQLRGRSGRQGDAGSSVFYLSFEDSLLRIFATRHITAMMDKLNIDEDEAIEAKMVSRTIENAQRKVESHHFDIRRQLLEYDDIANEQRRLIYQQREDILNTDDIANVAKQFRLEHIDSLFNEHMSVSTPEEDWQTEILQNLLMQEYRIQNDLVNQVAENNTATADFFCTAIKESAEKHFENKFVGAEREYVENFMRSLILNIIDDHWRNHLLALDSLRLSIGFRGMAQKNPKQEYKREAFEMFSQLLSTMQFTITKVLYSVRIELEKPPAPPVAPTPELTYLHETPAALTTEKAQPISSNTAAQDKAVATSTIRRDSPKVKRNDPCPCGSGKKYKHCCGKL